MLGRPGWAMAPALLAIDARKANGDLIDGHLAAWCRELTSEEILNELWGAGIPVAKVLQPHQQVELPPLQFRGFFESVEHPVTGAARHSTLPMRFSTGPDTFHARHAPLLGEDTRDVLAAIGVPAAQLDALEEAHVIGTIPTATS